MNKILPAILASLGLLTGCVSGDAPKPQPYLRQQGDVFMQAGVESYTQYNFALARQQFSRARDFYARYDDTTATARALLNLAQVEILSGQYDAAAQSLGKASALIEQNHLQLATHRDMLLSSLYLASNKLDDAEKLFAHLETSLRTGSNDDTSLMLLANRVRLAQLRNARADDWLNVFAQRINTGNHALNARLQRFQAWQAYQNNDTARGQELFTAALNTYRNLADAVAVMNCREEWAQAAAARGEWNTAIEQNEKLLSLAMANAHVELGLRAIEALKIAYTHAGQNDKLPQLENWKQELKALPADALAR